MAEFDPKVLREAMSLAGLSAQALAERAGLHRVTIANYARGLACPPETWARLERALRDALTEHARAVEKITRKLR